MHHKTQRKNDGSEEFDSPTKDDLLPEKLQRPEDPLQEAIKFLQPLQQLAAKDPETHLFAFEIYYRKGTFLFDDAFDFARPLNVLSSTAISAIFSAKDISFLFGKLYKGKLFNQSNLKYGFNYS